MRAEGFTTRFSMRWAKLNRRRQAGPSPPERFARIKPSIPTDGRTTFKEKILFTREGCCGFHAVELAMLSKTGWSPQMFAANCATCARERSKEPL